MNKPKSHGNRKAQMRRRNSSLSSLHSQYRQSNPNLKAVRVQLIDGNMSYYPVAFCKFYGGYMTEGLVNCHRCRRRNCDKFIPVERDKKGRIKENLFLKTEEN